MPPAEKRESHGRPTKFAIDRSWVSRVLGVPRTRPRYVACRCRRHRRRSMPFERDGIRVAKHGNAVYKLGQGRVCVADGVPIIGHDDSEARNRSVGVTTDEKGL